MANYDRAMAERVWKRVQDSGKEPEQKDMNLRGLIMNEWMAAAAYQQLQRQMGAREAAVLQRIAREEQSHAACLKGMYILMKGEAPVVRAPQPEKDSLESALRKCYAGELRSIAAYEELSSHPEYGHVFASMARQEREHSRAVLELLGTLQKKAASGDKHGNRQNM